MPNADTPDAHTLNANTLLRYDLTTDPFPLQASPGYGNANTATLTVVASNPNADPVKNPVTVQGVAITIPVGPTSQDLTADATSVGPVPPTGWTLTDTKPGDGSVEYVFTPQTGQGAVGKQGLAFTFNAVTINSQPGTCTVTVKEGSAGDPFAQLFVTKFPDGWGSVSFWADPPVIPSGDSTTLNWSGPSGATYTIEYYTPQAGVVNVPAPGEPALSNQGQYPSQSAPPLQLTTDTTFYLNVAGSFSGQTYNAQQSVPVTVELPGPRITSFTATPPTAYCYTSVSVSNQNTPQVIPVELSWTTENAQECALSGMAEMLQPNTSLTEQITQTTTYTLTAYGQTGAPAVQTITADYVSAVSIEASLNNTPNNGLYPYELSYNGQLFLPANSTVLIELIVPGRRYYESWENSNSSPVTADFSEYRHFSQWDESAVMIFTCDGPTNYRVTYPLGTILHAASK